MPTVAFEFSSSVDLVFILMLSNAQGDMVTDFNDISNSQNLINSFSFRKREGKREFKISD